MYWIYYLSETEFVLWRENDGIIMNFYCEGEKWRKPVGKTEVSDFTLEHGYYSLDEELARKYCPRAFNEILPSSV